MNLLNTVVNCIPVKWLWLAEVWLFLRLASSWRTCRTTGTTVWVCSPSDGCWTSCSPWTHLKTTDASSAAAGRQILPDVPVWPPSRSGRSVTMAVYSTCVLKQQKIECTGAKYKSAFEIWTKCHWCDLKALNPAKPLAASLWLAAAYRSFA